MLEQKTSRVTNGSFEESRKTTTTIYLNNCSVLLLHTVENNSYWHRPFIQYLIFNDVKMWSALLVFVSSLVGVILIYFGGVCFNFDICDYYFSFNDEKYLKGRIFLKCRSQVAKMEQMLLPSVITAWVSEGTTERGRETDSGLFSLEKRALFLPGSRVTVFKYVTMRCF